MKQWNKIFEEKGRVFLKPKKEIIKIAKIFKKSGVKKILDLGCGSGRHVVYLAKNGFDVFGYDIAKEGIKLAKEWLKEKGLKANFEIGSIYDKLPYKNAFFDAIISTHAIHHGTIKDVRKAIAEVKRVLKPSGLIFINLRKRRIRKYDPKNPIIEKYGHQKVSYKMIGPRTYMPIEGGEKGLLHYLFDKRGIRREFGAFKIHRIWTSDNGRHYCLLGQLKNIKNHSMQNIDTIVRAVILDEGKILLCKKKEGDYYFLPGGHVEFGETAEQALARELKEELDIDTDKIEYIGTIENIFSENEQRRHEINLIFFVEPKNHSSISKENHIDFFWTDTDRLAGEYIEPVVLKTAILEWLKDKKQFWGSEK